MHDLGDLIDPIAIPSSGVSIIEEELYFRDHITRSTCSSRRRNYNCIRENTVILLVAASRSAAARWRHGAIHDCSTHIRGIRGFKGEDIRRRRG